MALARILATMHDENGHIAIEGFYDKVHEWEPRILDQMKGLPFDEQEFRQEVGAPRPRRRKRLHDSRADSGLGQPAK